MFGCYGDENPAYADACIYGNRFPIRNHSYEYDETEEVFSVYFGIDTSKLTVDEETALINRLESLSWCDEDERFTYDREHWFEVTPRESPDFDDNDPYGYVEVEGYASESVYDKIFELLDGCDVNYTEKIKR